MKKQKILAILLIICLILPVFPTMIGSSAVVAIPPLTITYDESISFIKALQWDNGDPAYNVNVASTETTLTIFIEDIDDAGIYYAETAGVDIIEFDETEGIAEIELTIAALPTADGAFQMWVEIDGEQYEVRFQAVTAIRITSTEGGTVYIQDCGDVGELAGSILTLDDWDEFDLTGAFGVTDDSKTFVNNNAEVVRIALSFEDGYELGSLTSYTIAYSITLTPPADGTNADGAFDTCFLIDVSEFANKLIDIDVVFVEIDGDDGCECENFCDICLGCLDCDGDCDDCDCDPCTGPHIIDPPVPPAALVVGALATGVSIDPVSPILGVEDADGVLEFEFTVNGFIDWDTPINSLLEGEFICDAEDNVNDIFNADLTPKEYDEYPFTAIGLKLDDLLSELQGDATHAYILQENEMFDYLYNGSAGPIDGTIDGYYKEKNYDLSGYTGTADGWFGVISGIDVDDTILAIWFNDDDITSLAVDPDIRIIIKNSLTDVLEPDTYTITASAGAGGSISPSGAVEVEAGADKTFTITPNINYIISSVIVDGVSKGAVSSYTFLAVDDDHTINVTFTYVAPVAPPVTPPASGGGDTTTTTEPTTEATTEAVTEPEDEDDEDDEIENPFGDVEEEDWFYNAALDMFARGLMIGISEDEFAPELELSRAMLVTILYRYAGTPDVSDLDNPFDDVDDDSWYADAVKWAVENGIVLGYGDGTFGTNDSVTKEQLAVLIYRTMLASGKIPPDILADFEWSDFDDASDWAKTAINALTLMGIFKDIPGDSFNPQEPATRAEIASIISNFLAAFEAVEVPAATLPAPVDGDEGEDGAEE